MMKGFSEPRRFFSLACLFLLVALATPSSLASTATRPTISKTVAVPLPSIEEQKSNEILSKIQDNGQTITDKSIETEDTDEETSVAFVGKTTTKEISKITAVYEWYMDACTNTPLRAKGLTSATIAALGDIIAQNIEGTKSFSPKRVATFFFCNLLFTGPFIHMWYTFLNIVGDKMTERFGNVSKLKMTVTQVFLDQTLGTFVFFPLYVYVYDMFDSVIRLNRLPSLSAATEKCKKHVWGIILTQYRVFPFSNMINFGLVPYEMRVLFTSTVSLFWNIYLCSVVGK